ncbi:hypothetical protein RJ640_027417 [Escallonia rubra]|uniref:Uncharacterized protein n=1 Tax=Escallonia rubra TaxID=112253 RepID=A0AA88R5C7_9ASTE|nr:hypothetical protein RJ640_027417 [Escallonia rubra]
MPIDTMSYINRDATTVSKSRRGSSNLNDGMVIHQSTEFPVLPSGDLPSPFGELGLNLTDAELRETAYEVFAGACRSSGGSRPLTYVSQPDRTVERSFSTQRTMTSAAASKVKKALGLRSVKRGVDSAGRDPGNSGKRKSVGEVVRVQMRVSEQADSRVRRALLRIAAGQLGRRIEAIVLPVELLQQFKPSDFPTQREYEACQKRIFKILEAGLLLHPKLPLDKTDTAPQRLRQIISGASERPIGEVVQALRSVVMSLACRSFDGSASEVCHWADGVPLNLRLYQILLEACFDVNDATSVIEEIDDVLELIKKTWVILGIDQMFHNLCFLWILFHRYVATGQVENDLLFAADNMLFEVGKDAKSTKDPAYSKILSSTLSSISGWAETQLMAYHGTFYRGNIDLMQSVLSLGLSAAKIMIEDISQEYRRNRKEVDVLCARVDTYIRSSLRAAFAQASSPSITCCEREKVKASRKLTKSQINSLPVLSILAQDVSDLAFNEKEIYSPILKRWHPLATGVAVATLHACYGDELKQFVSAITEMTPDALQVLIAADKLEKDLVQMAVEDSVDSDDGGKAIVQEMTPYEAEGVIAKLVKTWIRTRIDTLKEWIDRNLQQEIWNPRANKDRFGPSAVEVLRIIDETLEAFFLLPIPTHTVLLPDLMSGLDRCLQHYISKAKSGCGSRTTFMPVMPVLTRCTTGSRFGVFKKRDKSHTVQRRKPLVGTVDGDNSFGIPQLCVRINTLHQIRKDLEVFEKRTMTHLRNTGSTHLDDVVNGLGYWFEQSAASCVEGIKQLCEATAYKVIFHDLSHVLWDGLYVGEVSSARIEPFLQELEQNLEVISATVHDRVRTRVITDVMKASFDGFLLVLLAGGPSRVFTLPDSTIIDEDFKFLMDLFWSEGDGLPTDLIDKFSTTVKRVLPLFHTSTESLIEQFRHAMLDGYGASDKSKLTLPTTSGQWSPTEPSTLLRILCNRNDKLATKFLKRTYNLPKKL